MSRNEMVELLEDYAKITELYNKYEKATYYFQMIRIQAQIIEMMEAGEHVRG